MAKKSGTTKGLKKTPSSGRAGAGKQAMAASRGGKRKTAGAKTPKGKAGRKQASNPPRTGKLKRAAKAAPSRKGAATTSSTRKAVPGRKRAVTRGGATQSPGARSMKVVSSRTARRRAGGTGREETLAQTPETGRTRGGPTNPLPTKRSTGTAAGAGTSSSPRLERARRQLREVDETVPSPPSSLDLDRTPSAARSGRKRLQDAKEDHNETSPVMTGGDVDADWEDAYSVGDEAPGGDNPTPDQDRVDDIGKALGVTYEDNEELKASDKIADRDKHRWELDPASSEDYTDRD